MPRYEFLCPKCDIDFERDLPVDHSPQSCPQCYDTNTKKLLTAPSFSIKGQFTAANNYGLKTNERKQK